MRLTGSLYVENFTSMSWKIWFSLLFVQLLMTFNICTGDDFDDNHCKEYTQINETEYDRDPKSVNDLSKRPLGFMSVVIPFETNNTDARNPCFKISLDNSARQTVQVLATSVVGDSTFCVKSQPPYAQPTCQSGIKTCQDSAIGHDSIKYVFYCDGCESDLPIWFRLTVSPSFTDGLDFENWCGRNAEYPLDSLISLTVRPTLTTKQIKSTNNNTKSNAPVPTIATTASANQIKSTNNNTKSNAPVPTIATTSKASHASLTFIWLLSVNFAFLLLY